MCGKVKNTIEQDAEVEDWKGLVINVKVEDRSWLDQC